LANKSIKVENLSKIYRLGEIGTGTISRDIERFVKTKILNKEDPFLKIGEVNNRAINGASDIVYSLKDINFEIEQGDAVGIIGRNGAGKSTLLKILSRVTSPSTGKINIKGRVASLLEVGTGFHPELTGRENIYLNGAILGMRKREIDQNLDEIIDFSGVERYIDTPVKRYSSGMYVRLAFAVAAHLESEILIVDEVLAVGDAEFQKKCLGKMGEVNKGEGRTVLFVSHNMDAISKLCANLIFLEHGKISYRGNVENGLNYYFQKTERSILPNKNFEINKLGKSLDLIDLCIRTDSIIATGNEFVLTLKIKNKLAKDLTGIRVSVGFLARDKMNLLVDNSIANKLFIFRSKSINLVSFKVESFPLGVGRYSMQIYIESHDGIELFEDSLSLDAVSNNLFGQFTKIRPEWDSALVYTKFIINNEEI